ncbi:L-2-hydroxyglutarate oxidase [Rhizobium sp. Leaf453]|uniref:L-2-hydroxyglutarate oxidase n=2 Tax=unclassified Rhizobium TaxID=2613769 RepID=UPI000712F9B7|nr:L-2-hydroxyglutarate oxidase [Rhizobium sp. Leaf453]KQU02135.1 hydroxyglutarate oxidase [Rhizobium sp. Leaf453]
MIYDFCVIGAGIVGLATAVEILRRSPDASIAVLEKEDGVGQHQTGRNSGVIHAGIYYKPGSLKADLCRRGAEATRQFCLQHSIPFETRGKLVVATSESQLPALAKLAVNGRANGVPLEIIGSQEMREREPNVAGAGAILVADSGIVDFSAICTALANLVRAQGGEIFLGAAIHLIREEGALVTVGSVDRRWQARRLVVCAGLQSDRMAHLGGLKVEHRIIPFRGEYYSVVPAKRTLVHHMIYPVPDPALPFLGIHLTPMIDGGLTVGPNAVLGLAREGYSRFSANARDMIDTAAFPGFWRLARKFGRSGIAEVRYSISKSLYLEQCRKLCPHLLEEDLTPRPAGIRAQAVTRQGELIHDFLFLETSRMLHVCNAPSPAATSALPIAELIVDRMMRK